MNMLSPALASFSRSASSKLSRAVAAARMPVRRGVALRTKQVETLEKRSYMWGGGSAGLQGASYLPLNRLDGYQVPQEVAGTQGPRMSDGLGATSIMVNPKLGKATVGVGIVSTPFHRFGNDIANLSTGGGEVPGNGSGAGAGDGGNGGGSGGDTTTGGITDNGLWWSGTGKLRSDTGATGVSLGFALSGLPYLGIATDNTVTLFQGSEAASYDSAGGGAPFAPRGDDTGIIRQVTVASREYVNSSTPSGTSTYFIWSGNDGTRMYFDTSTGLYRGQTDPYGNETTVRRETGSNYDAIAEVDQHSGGQTGTVLAEVSFSYSGSSDATLTRRTVSRLTGGTLSAYRWLDFDYYTSNGTNGSTGQLKFISAYATGSATPTGITYFRYGADLNPIYLDNGIHQLTTVFAPAQFARLPSDFDAVGPYGYGSQASSLLYYADGEVTTEVVAGAGASSGSGQGTFTYTYADLTTGGTGGTSGIGGGTWGVNEPVQLTTITRADGSRELVYLNAAGQTLIDDVWNGLTGASRQDWVSSNEYDAQDRLSRVAEPSAIVRHESGSYSGSDVFWNDDTNNPDHAAFSASTGSGLIHVIHYAGLDTSAPAASLNLVASYGLSHGDNATVVYTNTNTYTSNSYTDGNGNTFQAYHLASRVAYPTAGSTTDQRLTSNAYTYTQLGIASANVALPAIASTRHGSGSAYHTVYTYDGLGRLSSYVDGEGHTSTYGRDLGSGAVTLRTTDAGGTPLVTQYAVDGFGRTTRRVDPDSIASVTGTGTLTVNYTPTAVATYFIYNDAAHSVRVYSGWTLPGTGGFSGTAGFSGTGPVRQYRTDQANGYSEVLSYTPTFNAGDTCTTLTATGTFVGSPTGTDTVAYTQSLSRTLMNYGGQVIESDTYFNLGTNSYATPAHLGDSTVTYGATVYHYDAMGRLDSTTLPTGTIYATAYDVMGRDVAESVGTTSGNMRTTAVYQYDLGGIGDSNLTAKVSYTAYTSNVADASTARATLYAYDWRDRLVWEKDGALLSTNLGAGTFDLSPSREVNAANTNWYQQQGIHRPVTIYAYDNLGEATAVKTYDGDSVSYEDTPGTAALTGKTTYTYDDWGRAFLKTLYSVDPSTGAVGTNALTTSTWFDGRGLVTQSIAPNGPGMMYAYDGAGRETGSYTVLPTNVTAGTALSSSTVIQQTEWAYDRSGNVTLSTFKQRFDDQTGSQVGTLGNPASSGTTAKARGSYGQFFYDVLNRETADVNVGALGTNTFTPYSSVPSRSATVLVTGYAYDAGGRVQDVTSPNGNVTRTLYDLADRVTDTYQHYVSGTNNASTSVRTEYAYDGVGHVTEMVAYTPGGTDQHTAFVYGVGTNTGSGMYTNDLLSTIRYADPSSGAASMVSAQQSVFAYDVAGEQTYKLDRNGTIHLYGYDSLGRLNADRATTTGSNVSDGMVAITYGYAKAGQLAAASTFSNTILDHLVADAYLLTRVTRSYNGFGQLVVEEQPGGTVGYSYSDGSANASRLTGMTYGEETLAYAYNSGIDTAISRVSGINALAVSGGGMTSVESYKYLGLDQIVTKGRTEEGYGLTYISSGATGDAGDKYVGLDRFGRVADQRYSSGTTGTGGDADRTKYTYDADSNPLAIVNVVTGGTGHSQAFTYDGLDRLTGYSRGTVTVTGGVSTPTVVATGTTQSETWNLDPEGNWGTFTFGGTAHARGHDAQNRLTTVGASGSLAYDNDGDQTTDESGNTLVWDAWGHLAQWRSTSLTNTYTTDGLGQLVAYAETGSTLADPTPTRAYVYSARGQVLVETSEASTSGTALELDYVYAAHGINAGGSYVDEQAFRDDFTLSTGGGGGQSRSSGGGETNAVTLADGTVFGGRTYVRQAANFDVTSTARLTYSGGTTTRTTERYELDPYGDHLAVLNDNFTSKSGGTGWGWHVLHQGLFLDGVTGLYYNRARWYDAVQGRFISQDPSGWPDGANRYQRELDRPTYYTDELGQSATPPSKPPHGHMAPDWTHGGKPMWFPDPGYRPPNGRDPVLGGLGGVLGFVWDLPNNALGGLLDLLGQLSGGTTTTVDGIHETTGVPWMSGGLTFGDHTIYGPGPNPEKNDPGYGPVTADGSQDHRRHERQHSIQSKELGPLYLLANLLGGILGVLEDPFSGDSWHNPWNFMESGPQSNPPRPW